MTNNGNLPVTPALNTLQAYTEGLSAKLAFCQALIKSGLVPQSFKTPEAILAVTLKGQELGFAPMQALELFDFIQGRVTIRAAGMAALIQSRGGSIEMVEEGPTRCILRGVRPDRKWTQEVTFTMEEAGAMGLTGKDNWKKMPRFMLYARCVSVLCRRGWADLLCGLYSTEEMADSEEERRPARKAKPEEPAIEAQKAPPEKPRFYQTETVPDEKRESAEKYLLISGARKDPDTGIWQSAIRLSKMDKYEISFKEDT